MTPDTTPTDDRPDLARLTDAQVRALLSPVGCSPSDYAEAARAGLVLEIDEDVGDLRYDDSHTDDGFRILAEGQCIADGLTADEAETLSLAGHGSSPIRFVMQSARWGAEMAAMVGRLRALGLMDDCPISDRPRQTPAARLVLALRERSKETP